MFRDRFWLSVLFTIPVLVWSPMIQDWLGFDAPSFPGSARIPFLFGTVVFVYGGRPFLHGGLREIRDRQPGMMLLISLAIAVAFVSSVATELGVVRPGVLVGARAADRRHAAGALAGDEGARVRPPSALDALAALLPDDAERVDGDERAARLPRGTPASGDLVLVRPGGRVPADGVVEDGAAAFDESMITGESRAGRPEPGRPGGGGDGRHRFLGPGPGQGGGRRDRAGRHPAAGGRGPGVPVAGPGARRSRRRAAVLRRPRRGRPDLHRVDARSAMSTRRSNAPSPCSSSPAPTRSDWRSRWSSRSPRRCRARSRDPGEGPPRARTDAHRRCRALRQDRHPDAAASPPSGGVAAVDGDDDDCSASPPRPRPRASIRSRARSWRPEPRQGPRRRHGLPILDGTRRPGDASTATRSPSAVQRCCASAASTLPPALADVDTRMVATAAPPCSPWSATAIVVGALALEDEVRPESRAAVDALHARRRPGGHDHRRRQPGGRGGGRRARRRRGDRRGPARGQGRRGGRSSETRARAWRWWATG